MPRVSLRDNVVHNRGNRVPLNDYIMRDKQYAIYIMSNKTNKVLYTGVTNNLKRRVFEHKEKIIDGFKYNIAKLLYYEVFKDIGNAIVREKQIKAGSRKDKIELIEKVNSEYKDLYDEI